MEAMKLRANLVTVYAIGWNLTKEMTEALASDPVELIERWWNAHSNEEERKDAEERGATASGAFAFVESVVRKFKHGQSACLPDDLTYQLAAIFMRNGVDGDKFLTSEELKREEAREVERKENAKAYKAKAQRSEAERKSKLTPGQKAEEVRIEAERKAKTEQEDARRAEAQAARESLLSRQERAKAIAARMRCLQLEFNF